MSFKIDRLVNCGKNIIRMQWGKNYLYQLEKLGSIDILKLDTHNL